MLNELIEKALERLSAAALRYGSVCKTEFESDTRTHTEILRSERKLRAAALAYQSLVMKIATGKLNPASARE